MILYWTLFYSATGTCHFPPALFHLQSAAEFRRSVDAVFVRGKQTERIPSTFSKYGDVQPGINSSTLSRSAWIPTHGMVV